MLAEFIPSKSKRIVYAIFGAIGLTLGALEVWYGALPQETPVWIGAALAVYAFVGTGIGFVAQRNAVTVKTTPATTDDGYAQSDRH